jgi:hypothetical protein
VGVQLLVRGVDHRAGLGEEGDLVGCLDAAGLEEDLLAVDDVDALLLEGLQHGHLGEVDAQRLARQAVFAQFGRHLRGDVRADPGVRVEGAAEGGDARAGAGGRAFLAVAVVEPRVVELVVTGRRAEVPDDRFTAADEQREADQLVHRPGADVGGGHIADVGEVEAEQGAQLGAVQGRVEPGEPFPAQPVEVDALFPVDGVRPECADCHGDHHPHPE